MILKEKNLKRKEKEMGKKKGRKEMIFWFKKYPPKYKIIQIVIAEQTCFT